MAASARIATSAWTLRPAAATTVPEMNSSESPGRNGRTTSPVSAKITANSSA